MTSFLKNEYGTNFSQTHIAQVFEGSLCVCVCAHVFVCLWHMTAVCSLMFGITVGLHHGSLDGAPVLR